MSKRQNPSRDAHSLSQSLAMSGSGTITGTGTGVGTGTGNGKGGDRRKSSPANTVQQSTGKNSGSGSGSGKQIGASSHAQRRPRSKSGGSEYGMSEKEELTLGASLGRSVGDEFDSNSNTGTYTTRSPYSYSDDNDSVSNDSGRVRPLEKMLGLTPGYLRKPSPANCPAHFNGYTVAGKGGNRASPWLVFDPPQSSHLWGRQSTSPVITSSPSRTFSSSSSTGIENNNVATGSTGTGSNHGTGPIRLPAKKVTSVPMSLFSAEEHGEKRRKGDYFNLRSRHDDDDSHSFVSVASSVNSGLDKDRRVDRTLQQQLQQLVISPRTAFDDISVSSSDGSSSGKRGGYSNGYRKPPVPSVTGIVGVANKKR